jgi:large subunit ribosomal protein L14
MIQPQTNLQSIDNSGANIAQCIKLLKGSFRRFSYSGDYIIVSIKKIRFVRKVQKGQVHLGLIARTKKETKFKDGSLSYFGTNSLILLNKKKRLIGTRIFGYVSRNLRQKKFMRILLICGQRII